MTTVITARTRAPTEKRCALCGAEKPLAEFYALAGGKLGLTARCKSCVAAKASEWAAKNPERRREVRGKWNGANKDQKRAASIALRGKKKAADPVGFSRRERERAKAWAQKHPLKAAAALRKAYLKRLEKDPVGTRLKSHLASIKRRERAKAGGPGYTKADVERAIRRQKGQCWWCPKQFDDQYHIDHLFPLAADGPHAPNNIVISCPTCNLKKGAKMPWQFAGRLL